MFLRTTAAGWAAFLLRLSLGLLLFVAGLTKFLMPGGPAAVMEAIAGEFTATWLPLVLVKPFAFGLPFLEVALGLFLLAGLHRVPALVLSGLLLVALFFGQLLLGGAVVAAQIAVYLVVTAAALALTDKDSLTLENLLGR